MIFSCNQFLEGFHYHHFDVSPINFEVLLLIPPHLSTNLDIQPSLSI